MIITNYYMAVYFHLVASIYYVKNIFKKLEYLIFNK